MTFRAKPVVKREHRSSWDSRDRRNFLLNLGFGLVVLAALVILVVVAVATWYNEHFAPVASVNGTSITRDEFRARYRVEVVRVELAQRRIRDEFNAGRITQQQLDAQLAFLGQRREQAPAIALERLVDGRIQAQLAAEEGVTVDEATIDERLLTERTLAEQRHLWVIEVAPEVDEGAAEPTEEQVAAARAKADQALDDLEAGKAWEDVAKSVSTSSTAPTGGDYGWISEENSALDEPFAEAVFALEVNGRTGIVEGEDGAFRIGRVTDVVPERLDLTFEDTLAQFEVTLEDYREVVRVDATRAALEDKVVAQATGETTQRRVAEIFIEAPQAEPAEGSVRVRHILYAPNDDPSKADELEDDDPAWKEAEDEARATYEVLQDDITKFDEIAREESDEGAAASTGGKLPYYDEQSAIDPLFAAAIFKPGLEPGQLLEPVRTGFGWHVIQVMYFPPDIEQAERIKAEAEGGADFAQLARDFSDAPSGQDGGDAGWIAPLQRDPDVEEAIFGAEVGSVTEPIEVTGDGIYLYKVLEEAVRAPEGDQLAELEANAFPNWYAEKRAAFDIDYEGSTPDVAA